MIYREPPKSVPPRNEKPGTAEKNAAVLYYRRKRYRQIFDIPETAKVGTAKKPKNREPPKKVLPYCNTAPSESAEKNGSEVNPENSTPQTYQMDYSHSSWSICFSPDLVWVILVAHAVLGGTRLICTMWHIGPGLNLCYTDPA